MSNGKVVLITGSSNGFGRLTAEALARKGYSVMASMRDIDGRNAKAKEELLRLGQNENLDIHVFEIDVADEASVNQGVAQIIEANGHIDILINNAGTVDYGVIESFPIEQIQRLFEVNVFGPLRMNRAVLPTMRQQQAGLIISLSSGLGRLVFPTMGVYSASKFALEALSETYRYELAQHGIDCVIVEPGVYPTNINVSNGLSEDAELTDAYGDLGKMASQLPIQFRDGFQDRDSNDITRAIIKLIETPSNERPLRTCVGAETDTLAPLNKMASQVQGGLMEAFGLPDLMPLTQ